MVWPVLIGSLSVQPPASPMARAAADPTSQVPPPGKEGPRRLPRERRPAGAPARAGGQARKGRFTGSSIRFTFARHTDTRRSRMLCPIVVIDQTLTGVQDAGANGL